MRKSHRNIEILRKLFPGRWRYSTRDNIWIGDSFNVEPRSCISSRTPNGDDDNFVTRYYRSDTGEQVYMSLLFA